MHFPTIALYWTLLHSLWQGLLFAGIASIALYSTRNATAGVRYTLLSIVFALFLLTCGGTFLYECRSASPVAVTQGEKGVTTDPAGISIHLPFLQQDDRRHNLLKVITTWLSLHTSLLFTTWVVVFVIKSIRLFSVLFYTRHIRDRRTSPFTGYWENKTALLCRQLHINKAVTLLGSAVIKIPVVFGHIRPVILFPVEMITHLQAEQIEAILIHELAHIRRNDYLVNLLQNFAETIFFFNPFVWWISSYIRQERENCCDDIVIGQTKDKKQLVDALLIFRKYRTQNGKLATSLTGNKDHFVDRIRHIVLDKNKTLRPAGTITLFCLLLFAGMLTTAYTPAPPQPPPAKPLISGVKVVRTTPPAPKPQAHAPTAKAPLHKASAPLPKASAPIPAAADPTPATADPFPKASNPLPKRPEPFPIANDPLPILEEKMRDIIHDLLSQHLLNDLADLSWFSLTDTSLYVNGIKEPDDIQQNFKEKYIIHPHFGFFYGPFVVPKRAYGIHVDDRWLRGQKNI
ncbi:MAG TPA: M56 family metallopeptidase [Puia sp.]|jgi:beta-lactamase regulating signal transducer with metallopeptidase domain